MRILTKLTDAEIFEQFLHTKYVGAKRFSLEGAESLIPLLELVIEDAGYARRRRDRDRHGPPRPPERARQHHGEEPAEIFAAFEDGSPELSLGTRRREVPPRLLVRPHHAGRHSRCTSRSPSTRATSSS